MLAVLSNTFLRFWAIFFSNFKVFSLFWGYIPVCKKQPENGDGKRAAYDRHGYQQQRRRNRNRQGKARQDKRGRYDRLQGKTIRGRDGWLC